MWEDELLAECRMLLHDIISQTHLSDQREWQPVFVRGYSVCGFYQLLTS